MPLRTFDTLKYVCRLEQAGLSSDVAEAQAEVLTEAFNVNLESLVSKEYLAAQMAEQRAYMDTRFAEQESRIDSFRVELKAEFDSKFRTLTVMMSIIMAAVILPYLERLLAL